MLTVPDKLNITLRTSIPGKQVLTYTPAMTLTDAGTDDSSVKFNPLIKLTRQAIDSKPEYYRIRQFFNTSLFQSLMNSIDQKPLGNLTEAIQKGYVDNNIQMTLGTLFSLGSVINIGGNVYTIADYQWSNGDWKKTITNSSTSAQSLATTSSGFSSPFWNSSGIAQKSKNPFDRGAGKMEYKLPREAKLPMALPLNRRDNTPKPALSNKNPSISSTEFATEEQTTQDETSHTSSEPESPLLLAPQPSPQPTPHSTLQPAPALPPLLIPQTPETPAMQTPGTIRTSKEEYFRTLQVSANSTRKVYEYFTSNEFYSIFRRVVNSSGSKPTIDAFYSVITGNNENDNEDMVSRGKLDADTYRQACSQMKVLSGPADGDCFFYAVAMGINMYNYQIIEHMQPITYNQYGTSQLFTSRVIRELVAYYVTHLPQNTIAEWLEVADHLTTELNDAMEQALVQHGDINQQGYMELVNHVYNLHENFLVYKPRIMPIDVEENRRPFRVMRADEIQNYLMSKDYWANFAAIEALCSTLNINIITFSNITATTAAAAATTTATTTATTKATQKLRCFVQNYAHESACTDRAIILYHENNHFELMTMRYLFPRLTLIASVFTDVIPVPFHMNFFIYGSYYATLKPSPEEFLFLTTYMREFNTTVVKLRGNTTTFNANFERLFYNRVRASSLGGGGGGNGVNKRSVIGGKKQEESTYNPDGSRKATGLTFSIVIDMELVQGKSMSDKQLSSLQCSSRYNSIRKAYAEIVGKPYVIKPVYSAVMAQPTATVAAVSSVPVAQKPSMNPPENPTEKKDKLPMAGGRKKTRRSNHMFSWRHTKKIRR